MADLLIDTDILIDVTSNDEAAKKRLVAESQNYILCVSVVTIMELVIGCRNKAEQRALNTFMAQFEVKPLSESISVRTTELIEAYALSHGLLIPDALIGATALCHNIGLLSKNQRDYRFIQDLNLFQYP
ncbi:MAG: type II toxin-antitoxin system VapC family toxin [Phormidesmis sp.]